MAGIPHFDQTLDVNKIEDGATTIVKQLRPTWNIQSLQFQKFTEGITNILIGVYQPSDKSNMILVRVFGEKTELIIDREAEKETFILLKTPQECGYQPPVICSGLVGRPRIDITYQQLDFFLEVGFTTKEIANLLSVSLRTVRNRMTEYGLSVLRLYSSMNDASLDIAVSRALTCFPQAGCQMVQGYLSSQGIRVQRDRIRLSLHRLDPMRQSLRNVTAIRRRAYSVASPLSLWHIDGNHKLIRWRFVVHGGIDGYSRTVVYLNASTDNLSKSVLSSFEKAVGEWGLPSRVRGDMGVENRDVATFMLEHPARGPGRGSFITGRSVHNTRIERLWRDVFTSVLSTFYSLFMYMEDLKILDPCNEIDIFSLHATFLSKINYSLSKFQETWNNHKMRTAGNKSPLQLFLSGMQNIADQDGNIANEYFEDLDDEAAATFGVDSEEMFAPGIVEDGVTVPESNILVTAEQMRNIETLIANSVQDALDFHLFVEIRDYLNN